MENTIDELLRDLDQENEIDIDDTIIEAAKRGDIDGVTQLLRVRKERELEVAVRQVSELQNTIFEKEQKEKPYIANWRTSKTCYCRSASLRCDSRNFGATSD